MSREKGFTLVELMITLTVLALIVGLAVPSFGQFAANNRLQGVSAGLFNALMQARAEAVARNKNVSVCASANGTSCLASADFAQGWIVYEDANSDDTTHVGVIIRREGDHDQVRTRLKALGSGTTRTFIRYTPTGLSLYGGVPVSAHRLSICDENAQAQARVLELETATGQVRTGRSQDADCS